MVQEQIINQILDSKDASIIYRYGLNDDYFSEYKDEFKFIVDHNRDYGIVPDKSTFLYTFPNFPLFNVNESEDYLVKELRKDRNKRFLARTFNQIRDSINEDDIDKAMSEYLQSFDKVSQENQFHTVDIFEDTSRYDAYVKKCTDFSDYYVKTGFDELDEIIGGWDRHEELATIVAKSNIGKSWALLKVAYAGAKQGLRVGIYSGEMSETKVGYRIDTLISHISNGSIIHGNLNVQSDYKRYIDTIKDRVSGTIKVLTPVMCGGAVGVNMLRSFIEQEKLDMLCIDQHSLLEDDRKAKNPVERANNISRDLKNLQVMKQIPIISVSQQNRTSTENGVGTDNIAQADRIGQDSTIVIFFERNEDMMILNLVKSRDSVNGRKLNYVVDFDRGIFQFVPTESDAFGGQKSKKLENEFNAVDEKVGEDVF